MQADDPIRVLLADDHLVFRFGLASIVDRQPDMRVVAEAWSGRSAVALYCAHRPDVTVMDLCMPGEDDGEAGGLEAIAAIRRLDPDARIVAATIHGADLARRALSLGAAASVMKDSSYEELLDTVRALHHRPPRVARPAGTGRVNGGAP